MLKAVGWVFILLSFLAALPLLLGPTGITGFSPSVAVWILYPALLLIGSVIACLGEQSREIRGLVTRCGAMQLFLACSAAAMLVAGSIGMVHFTTQPLSLWYLLATSLVLGVCGVTVKLPVGITKD